MQIRIKTIVAVKTEAGVLTDCLHLLLSSSVFATKSQMRKDLQEREPDPGWGWKDEEKCFPEGAED